MSTRMKEPAGRLSDRAYDDLRRMIIRLELAPGSHVSEPSLSARLDHSKGSLRAALVRLAQEGLVHPIPRQGYMISPLTIKDARDIFDLRMMLEPPAAALAAGRVDRVEMRNLERQLLKYSKGRDNASFEGFLQASRDFRLSLPRASGNPRLTTTIADLLDALERYTRLNFRYHLKFEEAAEKYRALMALLIDGDGLRAEALTRAHLEQARDNVMQVLLSRPEIVGGMLGVGLSPASITSRR